MFAHTEATDPSNRVSPTHDRIVIDPKVSMMPLEISDEYLLENLEGMTVEQTILKVFGVRAANNMEQLYLSGNTLGHVRYEADFLDGGSTTQVKKDNFLALSNGWFPRALADGNIYDHENDDNFLAALASVYKNLPNNFKQMGKKGLAWLMSPNIWTNFQYQLMNLGNNALSAQAITGDAWQISPLMIPAYEVPLLDDAPLHTVHVTLNGTTPESLPFAPIDENLVVVSDTTVANTLVDPYELTTDYVIDEDNGTIARAGGSGIADGATVKVTFRGTPQLMLTFPKNLILGFGYDMKAEKDRNIYRQVDEWAISIKSDVNVEEPDAISLGINIQDKLIGT
jgi:hypothetical protein